MTGRISKHSRCNGTLPPKVGSLQRKFFLSPPISTVFSPTPFVLELRARPPIVLSSQSRFLPAGGGEDLEPYFFGPIEML